MHNIHFSLTVQSVLIRLGVLNYKIEENTSFTYSVSKIVTHSGKIDRTEILEKMILSNIIDIKVVICILSLL